MYSLSCEVTSDLLFQNFIVTCCMRSVCKFVNSLCVVTYSSEIHGNNYNIMSIGAINDTRFGQFFSKACFRDKKSTDQG